MLPGTGQEGCPPHTKQSYSQVIPGGLDGDFPGHVLKIRQNSCLFFLFQEFLIQVKLVMLSHPKADTAP